MTERVFSKKNCILILIYFTILETIRVFQFPTIQYYIELVISIITVISVCIWGRKVILYGTILFVTVMMQFDHTKMYAALLFYVISAFIRRKYLIPLTIIYHCNTLVIWVFDKVTLNINILLYYSICVIIFILIYTYPKKANKVLNLTADEILILKELSKGKLIKEIDIFSKNTITHKLQSACNRNNLIDKNELIYLFKANCE